MSPSASPELAVRTRSQSLRSGVLNFNFKRQRYVLRYTQVSECPACGRQGTTVDFLNRGVYRFGPFDVAYPDDRRIPIKCCGSCGLVFKSVVPDSSDLGRLFAETAAQVWSSHQYHYRHEREYVMRFVRNTNSVDILDVGAGDGDLLNAFKGVPGRRSALDVVRNESCANQVRGEYILQYLEDPLQWSGAAYDVVLAFDVMEHLYQAGRALSNLAQLTRPGGFLVVQTADAAYLKTTARLRDWWYLNLLEHHMAWTPESLARVAKRAGFRLEHSEIGRHKDSRYMPAWKRVGVCVFRVLARIPGGVSLAVALTSHDPKLVSEPGSDDHFTAVLRRTEE
jgi:SAM-dependent methyltransferase